MSHDDEKMTASRRKALQLTLAVTAFGLALGKQAVDQGAVAKQVMVDGKPVELSAAEQSIFIKLSKTEQSYYIKLSGSERSRYIKMDGVDDRRAYLKLKATD